MALGPGVQFTDGRVRRVDGAVVNPRIEDGHGSDRSVPSHADVRYTADDVTDDASAPAGVHPVVLTAYAGTPHVPPAVQTDVWWGDWRPLPKHGHILFSTDATQTIQGFFDVTNEDAPDDSTVPHHSLTTPFAGAGSFGIPPIEGKYYRARVQNLAATSTTFNLWVFESPQAKGPFIFPLGAAGTVGVDPSFPAILSASAIVGVPLGGGVLRTVTITPTDAIRVRDEAQNVTQSGSLFTEGISDHVSLVFSRDKGAASVARLVDVSAGGTGTATHDATEGRAVFAVPASASALCYFESDKTLRYDEAGHMLRFEQTAEVPQAPLLGDESIEWGVGEDDGAGNIQNGIYWRLDADGLHFIRKKNGTVVSDTLQSAFNRDKLDGSPASLFRFSGSPQVHNPAKNNYYLGSYEWLGVAPASAGVQIPGGQPIVAHVQEAPNNITGTTVPEPNMPLFVRIKADSASPRVLQLHSGSWRGGTHDSKTTIQGRSDNNDLQDVGVHNDALGTSLVISPGHRLSQVFGRTPVTVTGEAVTADTNLRTNTASKMFYCVGYTWALTNSSTAAVARVIIRDGSGGDLRIPIKVQEGALGAEFTASGSGSFPDEGLPFATGVYVDVISGTVSLDIILHGYEEDN